MQLNNLFFAIDQLEHEGSIDSEGSLTLIESIAETIKSCEGLLENKSPIGSILLFGFLVVYAFRMWHSILSCNRIEAQHAAMQVVKGCLSYGTTALVVVTFFKADNTG